MEVFEENRSYSSFEEPVVCCVLRRPSKSMSMEELVETLSSSEDSKDVRESVVAVSWVERTD
jgi:hypothetical protein